MSEIRHAPKKKEAEYCGCSKCDGKGAIPAFGYYAQGVCFRCKGTGKTKAPKSGSASFAKKFILKYHHSTFFPENLQAEKIACIGFHNHQTAQEWLMKDNEFYYVGQPVCRSSSWYQIPVCEMEEFAKQYNKAFANGMLKIKIFEAQMQEHEFPH